MKVISLFRRKQQTQFEALNTLSPKALRAVRDTFLMELAFDLVDCIGPQCEDPPEVFDRKVEDLKVFAVSGQDIRPLLCQMFEDAGLPRGWGIHAWTRIEDIAHSFIEVVSD